MIGLLNVSSEEANLDRYITSSIKKIGDLLWMVYLYSLAAYKELIIAGVLASHVHISQHVKIPIIASTVSQFSYIIVIPLDGSKTG